ncbi:MAG TPA: general stress protein [Gemmataceae bacterium]|nr:general stress protein [Gemmataceae bacterium]
MQKEYTERGQTQQEGVHRGGSGNFAVNREKAAAAGRKGGQVSGGNFRHNPQKASEAGRKGGQHSHGRRKMEP